MLKYIFASILVLATFSCSAGDTDRPSEKIEPVKKEETLKPVDAQTQLNNEIKELEEKRQNAIKEDEKLAQLQVEKELAEKYLALAKMEVTRWEESSKAKDKEIEAERIHRQQVWLWWFSGVLGVIALVAFGLGIWSPIIRKWSWSFAAAAGSVASLSLLVAQLLPYLIFVGIGLAVIGAIALIIWNRNSFNAEVRVSKAINSIKSQVPNYKDHFKEHMDSVADKHFNAIRSHIK